MVDFNWDPSKWGIHWENGKIVFGPQKSKKQQAQEQFAGSSKDWDNDGIPNAVDSKPYEPRPNPNASYKDSSLYDIFIKRDKDRQAKEREEVASISGRGFPRMTEQQSRAQAMEEFFQQMQNMTQGSPTPLSYSGPSNEDLQARANTMASAQFDPQIEAIRRAMGETQTRAGASDVKLEQLYGALAGAYEQDVPKVEATYQNALNETAAQQQALQQALSADYGARTTAIDQLAASLGQEEAAAAGNEQIRNDQAFIQNLQNQMAASQQNALNQMQAVNTTYTQQGANLARSEGTNRRSDLASELESYLRESEGEIGGLTSQRQSQAAAAYMQMLSEADTARQQVNMQNTSMMNDWRQGQFSQMMDLFQARMAMDKAMTPEGPSASDMIAGQRLTFDQEQAVRQWVLDLTKDLKGQERIDAINFYLQQMGVGQQQ